MGLRSIGAKSGPGLRSVWVLEVHTWCLAHSCTQWSRLPGSSGSPQTHRKIQFRLWCKRHWHRGRKHGREEHRVASLAVPGQGHSPAWRGLEGPGGAWRGHALHKGLLQVLVCAGPSRAAAPDHGAVGDEAPGAVSS